MYDFLIAVAVCAIIVVVLMAYAVRRALKRSGQPKTNTLHGDADNAYFYYVLPSSRMGEASGIGIHASLPFDFRLEHMNTFVKMAAFLGFANPVMTGDPEFDTRVYAYSSNSFFYQALRENAALRKAILEIFRPGLTSIFYENKQVIACRGKGSELFGRLKTNEELATRIANRLHECIRIVASVPFEASHPSYRRAARIDRYTGAFLGTVCIISLIIAYFCSRGILYQLASNTQMLKLAAVVAILPYFGLFMILRACMSGTPYGANALRAFVQLGIVSIISICFSVLYVMDITMDKRPVTVRVQHITSKYTTTGKRGTHSYYIVVDGWDRIGKIDLKVGAYAYDTATAGKNFRFYSHPGYFNIEWISSP